MKYFSKYAEFSKKETKRYFAKALTSLNMSSKHKSKIKPTKNFLNLSYFHSQF